MKKRVLSALVALIVLVPIVIRGGYLFYFTASVIGLLGFRELLSLKEKEKDIPYFVKIMSAICFIYLMLSNLDYQLFFADYKAITIILFLILIPLVLYHDNKKYNISDALYLMGAIFFLGIAFNYLIVLRNFSMYYLVFLLLITIVTDTFAHLTGFFIGRHKLVASISPNKTIEGLIGGTIMGTFVSTVFYISVFNYTGSMFALISVVAFLSIVGQLGDLVFSSIKRHYGVKDFSNIMPGHGGVLDRLDSILFVLLAFSFIIELL